MSWAAELYTSHFIIYLKNVAPYLLRIGSEFYTLKTAELVWVFSPVETTNSVTFKGASTLILIFALPTTFLSLLSITKSSE